MIRLRLICHAATEATRRAAFPSDEPLDRQAAAHAGGAALALGRIDQALTSPALRAAQTAEVLGLQAVVDPALRDCDFGRWAGRTLGELGRDEPEALSAWLGDPDAAPHGGESLNVLLGRVSAWLIGRVKSRGNTVAVTHPAVIRAAVIHVLQAPPASFWRIDVEPLGGVGLVSDGTRWALRFAGPAPNPRACSPTSLPSPS